MHRQGCLSSCGVRWERLFLTLTSDNLRKQGIIIMNRCFMCKRHGESVACRFLLCAVAQESWSLVFCLFSVSWVMPYSMMELISC